MTTKNYKKTTEYPLSVNTAGPFNTKYKCVRAICIIYVLKP